MSKKRSGGQPHLAMTADGDSQDEAPAPAPGDSQAEAMDEAMDETRRSDAPVDERGGRYKFGSIYFEESRIKWDPSTWTYNPLAPPALY